MPSYCHPNWLAAWVSWQRLFAAADLAAAVGETGPVLDFGASVGELGLLVDATRTSYEFVEIHEPAAAHITATQPQARRHTLESAPEGGFSVVFALDSLEHNDDYPELIDALLRKLRPRGVFVLSGPTENALYRLGRRIAGFGGHYHTTNIAAIEAAMAERSDRVARRMVPWFLPLFHVSAWRRR